MTIIKAQGEAIAAANLGIHMSKNPAYLDLKRIEAEEAGLELGEHAMHKDQAAEEELQNTIFEEEAAIAEGEKNKAAVDTQMGHLKADLVTEARLRGKINTETSEFTAAAHSYAAPAFNMLPLWRSL